MFTTIARFLFGGEEETPEVVKSAEGVQEGWLVVPHQEAVSREVQDDLLIDVQQSDSALHEDSNVLPDSSSDAAVVTALGSEPSTSQVAPGSLPQSKAAAELTRSLLMKESKAWPDRQHVPRHAVQRHSHVSQRAPAPSFHLKQPGQRSLDH